MDASAIETLIDSGVGLTEQAKLPPGIVLTPARHTLQNTEQFQTAPTRFRRAFTTRRIDDFLAYLKVNARDSSAVFIDPDMIKVVAVLNHGSGDEPQWGDNLATLDLRYEPEFAAFVNATRAVHSQRAFIEYLEDWLPTPQVSAIDADGAIIDPKVAIGAVRRVTIAARAESTHQSDDMQASRSALEQIEARGAGDPLPAGLRFYGTIYHGLADYTVTARLGIRLSDKEPTFTLRLVGWDAQQSEIATEIETRVRGDLPTGVQVYTGTSKGNYTA